MVNWLIHIKLTVLLPYFHHFLIKHSVKTEFWASQKKENLHNKPYIVLYSLFSLFIGQNSISPYLCIRKIKVKKMARLNNIQNIIVAAIKSLKNEVVGHSLIVEKSFAYIISFTSNEPCMRCCMNECCCRCCMPVCWNLNWSFKHQDSIL